MKNFLTLLIFVSVITSCSIGEPVKNNVENSSAKLELIATTPEGVKVYIVKVTGNFETYLAVSSDGKSVSLAKH